LIFDLQCKDDEKVGDAVESWLKKRKFLSNSEGDNMNGNGCGDGGFGGNGEDS
jgi:hypothetical protein